MKNISFFLTCFLGSFLLNAEPLIKNGRIPEETESMGGHALGFGNEGVAAASSISNVRTNPAMMSFEKTYQINATYHWPTFGREFYQLGILDSKTSDIAAGFLFSHSRVGFKDPFKIVDDKEREEAFLDSSIEKRLVLGLSKTFDGFSFGAGVSHIIARDLDNQNKETHIFEKISGTSMNVGVAGLLTPELRFSLSGENINRTKISEWAPKTYRIGLAYTLFSGNVTTHLDLKQRNRVKAESSFYNDTLLHLEEGDENKFLKPEKSVYLSFSARVQNLVRVLGAYSQAFEKNPRKTISAGVAVVTNAYSFSYLVSDPYFMDKKKGERIHHGVNLTLNTAL